MAPRPYSERSSLPNDSAATDEITGIPIQIVGETPSPSTHSTATTPSPTPIEVVPIDQYHVEAIEDQHNSRNVESISEVPCYPTQGDIMPYDHSLPDFIRQITNQPNLSELHSLSLRVISTLISLHRMSTYLPNLRELDLEGSVLNSLRDIGCSLKNLQILKVGRCQLESLDGTFGLSSLRELYAQKNMINDVSPCSNLPHIRHVDVSFNRIRNISYAGFLSVCGKLKSIVFTGNPATEVSGYRKHVRRILPQIESLDGEPFSNEEEKELEFAENYWEDSECSSREISDFLDPPDPSDGKNNLLDSDEDLFVLEKRTKHVRNIANQDKLEGADYEVQEVITDIKQSLQNLGSHKGILEQSKITEIQNQNIKHKSANIQKLDKDIENRSKKSNLLLNANFNEECISLPKIVPESPSKISNTSLSSSLKSNLTLAGSSTKNSSPTFQGPATDKVLRPSTTDGVISKFQCDDSTPGEKKSGAIKKRCPTAHLRELSSITDDENRDSLNSRVSKLTSGLPVCGNLAAALINREKIQSVLDEEKYFKFKSSESVASPDKNFKIQLTGSGDNTDRPWVNENEDDIIEEGILESSQKWREAFRRFRSNNRSRWEEEDKADYSHLMGDMFEEKSDSNDVN